VKHTGAVIPAAADSVSLDVEARPEAESYSGEAKVVAVCGDRVLTQAFTLRVQRPATTVGPHRPPVPVRRAESVTFGTVDGVELAGTFYPSDRGKKAACVLLLHRLGGSSEEAAWRPLAEELQRAGCAVLAFDFRGHGGSTAVADRFWDAPHNSKGLARRKDVLSFRDFKPEYAPVLGNDVAAAKAFLDQRNDRGECNSANLLLVGEEDAGSVALLWIMGELRRFRGTGPFPAAKPLPANPQLDDLPEGKQVACVVWLSLTPALGRTVAPVELWVQDVGKKNGVPMGFVFGAEHEASAAFARKCLADLTTDGARPPFTAELAVKDSKAAGHALLEDDEPRQAVVNYVGNYLERNALRVWQRQETGTPSWWNVNGKLILARDRDESLPKALPLDRLWVR
jgi:pimeloyl-ACP methyl ester carboxylesterase